MTSYLNTKAVTILFILSISAICAHRTGLLDTSFSLTSGKHLHGTASIQVGNVTSILEKTNDKHSVECALNNTRGFNLCGLALHLGEKSNRLGLNLQRYDYLTLSLTYLSPDPAAKLKVSFRNYNANYSNKEDPVSLKFNTISYSPSKLVSNQGIRIPLSSFQVETWWIEQYNISFNNSQPDFSNINHLEFLTSGMNNLGKYKIEVTEATLHGKFLSETNLLRLILLIWLITIIALMARQKNKLQQLSYTDHLTGLLNRRGLRNWVNNNYIFRKSAFNLSLFYLDIDDFKKINDTYGHQVGDQLLNAFSDRIKEYLNTQIDKYTIARLSGDEFIILFKDLEKDALQRLGEGILAALKAPMSLEKRSVCIHVSLGIAQTAPKTLCFDDLLSRADSAMYYAKKDGKNQYKIFDNKVADDIFFKKQIAEKIEQAILKDCFYLNFMPIFNSHTLKIKSAEVLMRSTDKLLNRVGPHVFIPIAEEFDLIKKIDLWVIEHTFKQMNDAQRTLDDSKIIICINISALELHNPLFTQQVQTLIKKYNINPHYLEFELTETSLVETDNRSVTMLAELRALGIKLALDDFGTGYTAFNQLIHYPVDCLKIDKSFIDKLTAVDQTHSTMIKAILSIAKSYKLTTIAEGIETYEQYHYLAENGCDYIQGYLFAKPMQWDQLENLLMNPETQQLIKQFPPPTVK